MADRCVPRARPNSSGNGSRALRGGHRAHACATAKEAQSAAPLTGARSASLANGRSGTRPPAPWRAEAGFCPQHRCVAWDSIPAGGRSASASVEPHHDSHACKLRRFLHISTADASTASPFRAAWRLARYLSCLRYCGLGHLARDCCWPKATLNGGGGLATLVPATVHPPSKRPSVVHQLHMGRRWGQGGVPRRPIAVANAAVLVVSQLRSSPGMSHPPPPMLPVLQLASSSLTLKWRRSVSMLVPPLCLSWSTRYWMNLLPYSSPVPGHHRLLATGHAYFLLR